MDSVADYDYLMGFKSPAVWHVVFLPKKAEHWFDYLSPAWCRHVLAFGYNMATNTWTVVDPRLHQTLITTISDEAFTSAIDEWRAANAVMYTISEGDGSFGAGRVLQTCSTIILRVIGLRGRAFRPIDLVRILRRNNAKLRT